LSNKVFNSLTVTSLVTVVALRIGKIIKNDFRVFEIQENCYKMVYYIFCLG